jgi:hypothetical protein
MLASRCTYPVAEGEEVVSELKKAKQDNIMRRLEQAATYTITVKDTHKPRKITKRSNRYSGLPRIS